MLPWQNTNWHNLTESYQKKRLAHGLLLHGPAGIGKNEFAIDFAHWLLCEQPNKDKACGECKSCKLIHADSNPDLLTLYLEDGAKAIKVDQVRSLIKKLSLTSHGTGYRVVIISPADTLNINASNSLLKTLEEPPENTLLILISDIPSKLMATIRSRTQMVRFDLPSEKQSLDWLNQQNINNPQLVLNLSNGAPLAAMSIAQDEGLEIRDKLFNNWQELANGRIDALESAAMWLKDGFKVIENLPLNWVGSWISDMIKSQQGAQIDNMANIDYAQNLQKLAGQVDLKALYGLLDRLNDTIRLNNTSANQLTLIEALLIHWAGLKRN